MTTLAEIEDAAGQLSAAEQDVLVSRLESKRDERRTTAPAAPLSAAELAQRKRDVAQWLEEMQEIGRRIEAKAAGGPSMVEIINEGRNRCS